MELEKNVTRDEKRNKILASATRVFAEKGFQYATMADIARGAGISTGLPWCARHGWAA